MGKSFTIECWDERIGWMNGDCGHGDNGWSKDGTGEWMAGAQASVEHNGAGELSFGRLVFLFL
jgi:hypothetical protein